MLNIQTFLGWALPDLNRAVQHHGSPLTVETVEGFLVKVDNAFQIKLALRMSALLSELQLPVGFSFSDPIDKGAIMTQLVVRSITALRMACQSNNPIFSNPLRIDPESVEFIRTGVLTSVETESVMLGTEHPWDKRRGCWGCKAIMGERQVVVESVYVDVEVMLSPQEERLPLEPFKYPKGDSFTEFVNVINKKALGKTWITSK